MTTEVRDKKTLMAEMKVALDKGDFKAVTKLSQEISKIQAATEKSEVDAKVKAAEVLTLDVKAVIDEAVAGLVKSGKLDNMDGVWYVQDFGEKLTTCRLVKSAPRKAGTGGGAAKKFDVATADLLAKHGSKVIDQESGKTFQQAYDEDTDGNSRYKVRVKLLKLEGS